MLIGQYTCKRIKTTRFDREEEREPKESRGLSASSSQRLYRAAYIG
jgi:hypothetical protein